MSHNRGPIGSLDASKPITIIGAGISGLLMGYHLKNLGFDITILEKESRVGGKVHTVKTKFGIQEKAANAIFTDPLMYELLDDLKLDFITAKSKLKKNIYLNNEITNNLFKSFDLITTLSRLLKRPPTDSNQSVYDFFLPLLGEKLTSNIISSALVGVYALDSKELHFDSIFKDHNDPRSYLSFLFSLIMKKRAHRGKSISFKHGMQEFIDGLRNSLNTEIRTTSSMQGSDIGKNTIICTSASEAALILKQAMPKASELLSKIEYSGVSTSTIITQQTITPLNSSFGVLIPPNLPDFKVQGILNNSEIFSYRTSSEELNSYTFIMKPIDDPLLKIEQDLFKMNVKLKKDLIQNITTTYWNMALPRYNLRRSQTIKQIRDLLSVTSGTVIFGNYIDGISIREINQMAYNYSRSLTSHRL